MANSECFLFDCSWNYSFKSFPLDLRLVICLFSVVEVKGWSMGGGLCSQSRNVCTHSRGTQGAVSFTEGRHTSVRLWGSFLEVSWSIIQGDRHQRLEHMQWPSVSLWGEPENPGDALRRWKLWNMGNQQRCWRPRSSERLLVCVRRLKGTAWGCPLASCSFPFYSVQSSTLLDGAIMCKSDSHLLSAVSHVYPLWVSVFEGKGVQFIVLYHTFQGSSGILSEAWSLLGSTLSPEAILSIQSTSCHCSPKSFGCLFKNT